MNYSFKNNLRPVMNRTAAILRSKSYLKTTLILPLRSQDFQSRSEFIQYNP